MLRYCLFEINQLILSFFYYIVRFDVAHGQKYEHGKLCDKSPSFQFIIKHNWNYIFHVIFVGPQMHLNHDNVLLIFKTAICFDQQHEQIKKTAQKRFHKGINLTAMCYSQYMVTSSDGNIFRATGHLCGEFTGHQRIPRTKASDTERWCFLWSASE